MVSGPPRSASEGIWAVGRGIELPCKYTLQCKERPLTCKTIAMTITEYSEVEKTLPCGNSNNSSYIIVYASWYC